MRAVLLQVVATVINGALARLKPIEPAHLRSFVEDRCLVDKLAKAISIPSYKIVWSGCPKREPPAVFYALKLVFESVAIALSEVPPHDGIVAEFEERRGGGASSGAHVFQYKYARPSNLVSNPAQFLKTLRRFEMRKLTELHLAALKPYIMHRFFNRKFMEQAKKFFNEEDAFAAFHAMFVWVAAVYHTGKRLFVQGSPLAELHRFVTCLCCCPTRCACACAVAGVGRGDKGVQGRHGTGVLTGGGRKGMTLAPAVAWVGGGYDRGVAAVANGHVFHASWYASS